MTVLNNANQYLPGVIAIPSALQITAITQAYPMVLTVTTDPVTASNTYIAGQVVRLNIPITYGMWQANGLTGEVLANTGTLITLNIDTTNFDAFSVPGSTAEKPASLSPAGSRNLQYSNQTNQVGFQSLNNVGN